MVSDDSDDDEVLNYYPKDSQNNNHVNKLNTIVVSSDDNIDSCEENESFKHKKRKSIKQANCKSAIIKNKNEEKPVTSKKPALIKVKQQRSKQISSKENASQNLASKECTNTNYLRKSSRVSKENASSTIITSPEKCNTPKTKNICTVIKNSKTKSSPPTKFKPRNSRHTSDDNTKKVSKNTFDPKSTSIITRAKLERNSNSRFLDSSSEEEEVTNKPLRGHKFKRLKLMSTSSSNSDSETSINRVKKKRTHLMSTSSSCSDKEQSIDSKNNEQKAHKPASDISQIKPGLRQNNKVHSISSSSDSEDNVEYNFEPTQKISNNKDTIKETPLLSSSRQQSNKSPLSQHNEDSKKNQNNVKPGNFDIKKTQLTKKVENNQFKSGLNSDVWKNIAKVNLKRPKSSSKHQSYLHTLKKRFISSNNPTVEIHKKIIDKKIDTRDNIELGKESCSKSKIIKKDSIQEEMQNICLPSNPQNLSCETSTQDNNNDNQPSIDLNINMNVQIICSPSLVEDVNSIDNRISTKSPSENHNKAFSPKLSLSLTHKKNKTTEIPISKLSSITEKNKASKSRYCDLNKVKGRTQHQHKLLKHNQTKQIGSKDKQNTLQTEKKCLNSESENKVVIENNESGTDVLSNILLEMDNNPFKVQKVLPKKALEPPAEMLGWGSSPPDLHSSPSQLHLPVNLQSSELENKSIDSEIQLTNKLACSKQAIAVRLPDKFSSIFQTNSSIIDKLENSNRNFQTSKQHKDALANKQKKSKRTAKKTLDTAITSFYSVNSEDYNRPHEVPNDKYTESNCHPISNDSNEGNMSHLQILNTNSVTSISKEITNPINNKEPVVERRITEVDISNFVSNAKSTSNDHSSSQQNVHNNCQETKERLYLENKTSAERNLKDKAYIQCVIDKLTKSQTKSKPPSVEKSFLVSDKIKNISFPQSNNNLNLGNTMVKTPKESTIPLEIGSINHCAASNKEVQESPDKEHNIVSDSKHSKGIRIRLGGNVYRLPGKENVIDSNLKAKKQKENILSTMIESKNEKATNISLNKSVNINTLSSPYSGNTESKSGKSLSSSEDSSDDSSSSDSDKEDKLVVSEKSSGTSSSESTSDDEKEESAVKCIKGCSKTSTQDKINKEHNEEVIHDNNNLNINITNVFKLNEPQKEKIKTFSLDELLGFHEKNEIKATFSIESSCKTVSDDTIILSSSSESESNEDTNNSICKSKMLEKNDNTVLDKNSEKICTETSAIVSKNKNSNLSVHIENKVCKIRVRSLEELGISNACPVPDNALQPSRYESKDEQSFQATNTVDISKPSSLEKVDSVVQEKSRIQPSFLKGKTSLLNRGTKKQKSTAPPFQDKTVTKQNIIQSDSLSSVTTISRPKINITTPTDKANKHSSNTHNSRVSTKQPNVSKLNVCSSNIGHILIRPSDVSLQPSVSNVSDQTLKADITPTALKPSFPRNNVIALVSVPAVNHTTTEATSPSSYVSDKHQNINKPQSEPIVKDVQTINPNEPTNSMSSQQNMERLFFKLCDELFCEVVMMKLPKLVDDLHLCIAHDIMREERLKKVQQLKCPETKVEEKKRTEKEFMETLKIRGQGFVPLFMTIVKKVEKEHMKTLIIAFYCKIVHQLEQIDPINRTYRFKLRLLIKRMLIKSYINKDVVAIFSDNITSFTSNFNFIESLLLKYNNFVINRDKTAMLSTPDVNNEGGTETITSHTEYTETSDNSESNISQAGKPSDTVIVSSAKPSTFEQATKATHDSSCKDLLTQPSGKRSNLPPVGNLDQLLLGAFCKKATSHKS